EEYDELLCFKFKDVGTLKHNLDKELILHSLGNQWQLTIMSSQDALFRIRLGEILPIVTSMSKLNNEFNYKFRIVNSVVKNSSENKVVMKGETSTQIVNYKVVDEDDGTSTLLVNIPHL